MICLSKERTEFISFSSCDAVNSRRDNWYPQHCQLRKHPGQPENNLIYDQSVFSTLFLISPTASRSPSLCRHPRTYTAGTLIYLSLRRGVHGIAVQGSLLLPPHHQLPAWTHLTQSWEMTSARGTRGRLTPPRCGGNGWQRHQPFCCSSCPGCRGRGRCTTCSRTLQFLPWLRQRSCAAQSSS